MRDLEKPGYVLKKNIAFEFRCAENQLDRLPALYYQRDFAEAGGLISYGTDQTESYRRAAVMVDKILKGTKAAEIPMEKAMGFEFVINLKAAKQSASPFHRKSWRGRSG